MTFEITSFEITTDQLKRAKFGDAFTAESVSAYLDSIKEYIADVEAKYESAHKDNLVVRKKLDVYEAQKKELHDAYDTLKNASTVAYQKAEAEAAHLITEAQKTKDDAEMAATRIKNAANATADNRLKDAREEANSILANANKKATQLLDDAKHNADNIMSKANQDASEIITSAKEEANLIHETATSESNALIEESKVQAQNIVEAAENTANDVIKSAELLKQDNLVTENHIKSILANTESELANYESAFKQMLQSTNDQLQTMKSAVLSAMTSGSEIDSSFVGNGFVSKSAVPDFAPEVANIPVIEVDDEGGADIGVVITGDQTDHQIDEQSNHIDTVDEAHAFLSALESQLG